MRRVRGRAAALSLLLLLPVPAPAEVPCQSGVKFRPIQVQPVTLRFRQVPIRVLFGVIEALTGTPFRVPAELDYTVTFDIRRVEACRALEIIAESQSLSYRQDGDTIVVIPPEPEPSPAARSTPTQ
jgi:hypothetical protein